MSQPSREVPKFSSFRAKKPPAQSQPSAHSTTLKRQRSPESHHHSVKRHRTPHSPDRPSHRNHGPSERELTVSDTRRCGERHYQRHQSRDRSAVQQPPLTRHGEDPDLFVYDGKGDRQNVAYERLHKYSIPPYQRVGYGNILGLALRFKIDRAESTIDKVFIMDKSATSKQIPQRLLLKRQKKQELPALLVHEKDGLDLAQDFVVLSPFAKDSDPVSSPDEVGSFRDLIYSTNSELHESSDVVSTADLQARQRNIQLIRATKTDPSDFQAWLDLASHQETLVSPGADAHALTNSERTTLADLRIAVFEKALKYFPQSEASKREQLILRLLHEGSVAWEAQKYMQRLQDTLRQHLTSFPIWTLCLNACQASPINFRFEDVKTFFVRSLRTLGSNKNATGDPEAQNIMLYLILRYTFFLRDTGYDELSIAIWQALCEYHLFRPEHLASSGRDSILADFEQFWESERPRFGEEGARGWYALSEDDDTVQERQSIPPDSKLASSLPFKSFSALEKTTNNFLRFPGRTMDQSGADDPFHVVFFSDIQDVLATTTGTFARDGFLDALLCYLGLPEMDGTASIRQQLPTQPRWRSDVFLDHGLLQTQRDSTVVDRGRPDGQRMQCYQTSTDLLFSRAFEGLLSSNSTPNESSHNHQQITPNVARFAQRILSSIVQRFPSDDLLAEYYLAFELSCFPNEVSRSAKNILRQRPSSLRLYNACATIEAKLGKTEKAVQIWSCAIKMKDSFAVAAHQELVLLWRGLIWCYLESNRAETARSHLASFGSSVSTIQHDSTSMSTATLLRLRKSLKDGFEHASSQFQLRLAALNAEMLALVAYLTETDGLRASTDAIQAQCDASLQRFSNNHVLLEMLHQIKASILAYHIQQKRPYRPAFIRYELETSIKLFPNNTIFLEMYRNNEARFRLDDRVRSILKTEVFTNGQSPLVGWTFAVDQELLRYTNQSSGSTAESVRSTFNRALMTSGSPVRYSRMLWMKWLQFEKQVALEEVTVSAKFATRKISMIGQQRFKKLKQVFLSGLHHLPWSKDWVLLGLDIFDRDDELSWEARDLKRLYNVLVERELRVRVEGLEDLLGGGQV